mmetsp:Transcript_10924/g.18509  ORF Transcript_10924/g.18509 Transcript_10924/m.18509 type:complete len:138 (-) Transcript_10924:193-606(-)
MRGKNFQEVKHAVLLEQARQVIENEPNQERIAWVASEASKRARAFARLLGEADAVAARSRKRASSLNDAVLIDFDGCLEDNDDCPLQPPPRKMRRRLAPDASPISVADLVHIFDDTDEESDDHDSTTKYSCGLSKII